MRASRTDATPKSRDGRSRTNSRLTRSASVPDVGVHQGRETKPRRRNRTKRALLSARHSDTSQLPHVDQSPGSDVQSPNQPESVASDDHSFKAAGLVFPLVAPAGLKGFVKKNAWEVIPPKSEQTATRRKRRTPKRIPGLQDEESRRQQHEAKEAAKRLAARKTESRRLAAEKRAKERHTRRQARVRRHRKRLEAKEKAAAEAKRLRRQQKEDALKAAEEKRETKSTVHFLNFIDQRRKQAASAEAARKEEEKKITAAIAIQCLARRARARRTVAAKRLERRRLAEEAAAEQRRRQAHEEAIRQADFRREREAEVVVIRVRLSFQPFGIICTPALNSYLLRKTGIP